MILSSAETCPYSAFIMQRRRDASIIRPQSSGAEPNFLVMQCGASYSPASTSQQPAGRVKGSHISPLRPELPGAGVRSRVVQRRPAGGAPTTADTEKECALNLLKWGDADMQAMFDNVQKYHLFTPEELYTGIKTRRRCKAGAISVQLYSKHCQTLLIYLVRRSAREPFVERRPPIM